MATITKKLGFENMISNPSLNQDSNADGVADGWQPIHSEGISPEYFMDPEGAQIISIYDVEASGFAAVESEAIPVTEGEEYTLSADVKGEGEGFTQGTEGTGPQLAIIWLDANNSEIDITTSEVAQVGQDWARISYTATAPTGATSAKVRLVYLFTEDENKDASDIKGLIWFRKTQFQPGDTATDYEENDFFEVYPTAKTYQYGWEPSETGGNNDSRCYKPIPLPSGATSRSPGMSIEFSVPDTAENPQFSLWMNISELDPGDYIEVFINGTAAFSYAGGWGNPFRTPARAALRGRNVVIIRTTRGTDDTDASGAVIDDFQVTWEEAEEEPPQIELPKGKTMVKYIDFEGSLDPFFSIAPKARGYDYGFARTFRQRYSGYYSYGVEDTDTGGVDEAGVPPTIPGNSKAGAVIRFTVPVTAIEPELSMKAKYIARPGIDTGRIYMNGEVIWERSETHDGWDSIDLALIPGANIELLLEYDKGEGNYGGLDDSIYVDDIVVSYNVPKKPITYIATAPETTIQTEAKTFVVKEGFETSSRINPFFKVQNPSQLRSGGGGSQYPEAGWARTNQIAYEGNYSYRAQNENLTGTEDAAIDFSFKVPFGVKNAKFEVWNFVETLRAISTIGNEKYPRLYHEYRIWVNDRLWKEFAWGSPNLTNSVHYSTGISGEPGNDYACPWGRWWKEEIPLTPGQSYTITFEYQRQPIRPAGTATTSGRNIQAIDNITVSWEESAGEVLTTPPDPLIFLDNRDGYLHLSAERGGAEMAPLSFGEYQVYDEPGAVHQYTAVDPRVIDLPVRITPGLNGDGGRMELRRMIRHLISQIANKPLALIVAYPEGDIRMLRCWFQGDIGREERSTLGVWWRKVILSFRAFDPFWYGDRITIDGDFEEDKKWISVSNEADYYTYPFIKIYGPINQPVIRLTGPPGDDTIYKEIRFNNFDLPAGRHIVIDTRPGQKTVILDDGTSLYQYISGSLFNIPVGEYGIQLAGAETDDNTKVVVEFEPAYWGV